MNNVKDFNIDLEYSLEERDNEVFDDFYKRIFPGISKIEFCTDLKTQKLGIDKIIHFESGNKFTIDEKKRREKYYDIALEYKHVYDNGNVAKGWVYKATCDYIVYAIMPLNKVYLLPTMLLKRAWHKYYKEWCNKYIRKYSPNPGYKSWNVFIPTEILLNAISQEMKQELINTS